MKRILTIAVLSIASLAGAVGCGKSEKAAETDAAVTAATASSVVAVVDAAAADAGAIAPLGARETASLAIPTPDRADRKAARQITNKNYKTELDSLEKEIGK